MADEQSQPPVAAVDRVAGHQQVAQIARHQRVALGRVALFQKTAHLSGAVGDQHREEVVAVTQPDGDADREGVDVFQDGGVLDAVQVGRVAQVNVVRGEFLAQHLGVLRVGADHREVGELAARDLLGVRRAGDDADLFVRQVVAVVDVFDDGLVVAGNDALDGRDDEFVLQRDRQRFEERLEVGRRSGQNDDVGFADHLVEVVGGGDAPAVELHVAQIAGVAAFAEQSFEHFGIADVPAYAGFVRGEQPHDGRRPAAVADHGAAGLFSDFVFHVRIDCFGLQM